MVQSLQQTTLRELKILLNWRELFLSDPLEPFFLKDDFLWRLAKESKREWIVATLFIFFSFPELHTVEDWSLFSHHLSFNIFHEKDLFLSRAKI